MVVGTSVSARSAKRRANSRLVGYVGNLLMADEGTLVQVGQEWVGTIL